MAYLEPPANAAIFQFPPSYRRLTIGGLAVFVGLAVLGACLALIDSKTQSVVIGAMCVIGIFGLFALLIARGFRRLSDRVAVSEDGIWYLPHRGPSTFIRWDEVANVQARDLTKCLVIVDFTGLHRINLAYQLEGFDNLRNLVLRRTAGRRRAYLLSVFHRSYLNLGFLVLGISMWIAFAAFAIHSARFAEAGWCVVLAVFTLYGVARQPGRITVSSRSIDINYLCWRRSIPFDSVTNVEIDNVPARHGEVSAAVFVDTAAGRSLTLTGVREGSVALYDSLRASWAAARGVSDAPSTNPADETIPPASPELPATFHAGMRTWLALAAPLVVFGAEILIAEVPFRPWYYPTNWINLIGIWCALLGIYVLVLLVRVQRLITVSDDAVAVDYTLWRRVVKYSAIDGIHLTKGRNLRGERVDVVSVRLRNGRSIKLGGVREGVRALYRVLFAAWRTAAPGAAQPETEIAGDQGSADYAVNQVRPARSLRVARLLPAWFAPAIFTVTAVAFVMASSGMMPRVSRLWSSRPPPDIKALARFPQFHTGWSAAPQPLFPGDTRHHRWNVDYATGLFTLDQTDFHIGDSIPINVTRVYLNRYESSAFGVGMSVSYDMYLVGDAARFTYVELIMPDGEQFHFRRVSPGSSWVGSVFRCSPKSGGECRAPFARSRLWWNGGGWSLRLTDGTLMKFPAVRGPKRPGQEALLSIADGHGDILRIDRDREGNILRITSPHHACMTMEHDKDNRITRATDSFGHTITYSYDVKGRLVTVNDSHGGVTRYSYDAGNEMVKIAKPGGGVWLRIKYDFYGRVAKLTFEDGSYYRYAYKTDRQGAIAAVEVIPSNGPARHVTIVKGLHDRHLSHISGTS